MSTRMMQVSIECITHEWLYFCVLTNIIHTGITRSDLHAMMHNVDFLACILTSIMQLSCIAITHLHTCIHVLCQNFSQPECFHTVSSYIIKNPSFVHSIWQLLYVLEILDLTVHHAHMQFSYYCKSLFNFAVYTMHTSAHDAL